MQEYERMMSGKLFDPHDEKLMAIKYKTNCLCREYNKLLMGDKRRQKLIDELLASHGNNVGFAGPIIFNYGINTHIGDDFYANFNFTVLDDGPINIGNGVMIGPNCSLMASCHPLIFEERKHCNFKDGHIAMSEYSRGITIKDHVWLACGVIVLDGVTIGEGSVIAAGSVVTRDIPAGVLAAGVPCKVIRQISEKDSKLDLL